jgi:predicted porin
MKKSTLALAAAVAVSVSPILMADTTLYGSARVSVDWVDPDSNEDEDIPFVDSDDDFWEVTNNASRLGVQGSEDLGNGLSAIYQYEFGVNVTGGSQYFESNRPRWVGLKGGFGAITLGTQWTPYYNVLGVNDFFYSARTFGPDIFLYPDADTREGTSVVYQTPDFGGFVAEAMVVADGVNNDSDVDTWNVGAKYKNGPFFAGLAYADFQNTEPGVDDTDLFGVALAYQGDPFGVTFTYEDGDASTVYGEAKSYLLLASYAFGNNVIAGQYGLVDPDESDEEVDYFVVGFQHNLSKRTGLWVEYIGRRDDEGIAGGDQDALSMGVKHDF